MCCISRTIQEEVETTWWFDTGAHAHVMPKYVGERTYLTLRGANGQDLGAMGDLLVRGFMAKTQVQFRVVVARDARRCFLTGPQLRAKGHPFILNQHVSFFTQPEDDTQVTMSRAGDRSLKVMCMLKP